MCWVNLARILEARDLEDRGAQVPSVGALRPQLSAMGFSELNVP